MRPLIIGITGKARAGKDTAGRFLWNHFGFRRLAYASPMKRMCAVLCIEDESNFHDDVLKEQVVPWMGRTRRSIMQDLGQGLKPLFGPQVWSDHLNERLKQISQLGEERFVITDVRHDVEAQSLIDQGGYILEVTRPGAGLSGSEAAHVSEAGINPDYVDFTVENSGSIGEFCHELRKVAEFVTHHGAKP